MAQNTRPVVQIDPYPHELQGATPGQSKLLRWLQSHSKGVQQFLTEHARGLSIMESLIHNEYQLWHPGAVAVVANVNDFSCVVMESGTIKRIGLALKVAGAGPTTVNVLLNGVAAATATIGAGLRTSVTDIGNPTVDAIKGDRLDYSVTVAGAGAVDLMVEVGVI